MLMIGGEFDLSIGSTLAFTGMIFGACIAVSTYQCERYARGLKAG